MIKIIQKHFIENDKKIAYCDVKIIDSNEVYTYSVKFDDKTKKRFNNYLRKLGFVVGVVDEIPADKVLEI